MAELGELARSDSGGSFSSVGTSNSALDQHLLYAQLYSRNAVGSISSRHSLAPHNQLSSTNPSRMSQEDFRTPKTMKEVHKITFGQALASYKMNLVPTRRPPMKQNYATRGQVKHGPIPTLKQQTSIPKGAVPRNGLDSWKVTAPEIKLPDIRDKSKGKIYYTRGRLGQKLVRSKPDFDLNDPNINKKVLKISDYSALHDPHCKTYFSQPSVLEHLKKQKLINNRREVLCNANEFNNYRDYLADLFGDRVKQRLVDNEGMKDLERAINRSLFEQKKKQVEKMSQEERAKMRQHAFNSQQKARKNRQDSKVRRWKKQLEMIEQIRKETQAQNAEIFAKRHWKAYQKRQRAEEVANLKKRNSLMRICYAELKNSYVTKYDQFVKAALIERFKADQAAQLVARDDQTDNMEELVAETLRRSRAEWIARYSRFVRRVRDTLLTRKEMETMEKERIGFYERKYFDRWVQYTARRKLYGPDSTHQSVFDRHLGPFVSNMKDRANPEAGDSAAVTGLIKNETEDEKELPTKPTSTLEKKVLKLIAVNRLRPIKFRKRFKSYGNIGSGIQGDTLTMTRRESRAWKHGKGPMKEEEFDYVDRIIAHFAMKRRILTAIIRRGRHAAKLRMSLTTANLAKALGYSDMVPQTEEQKLYTQRIANIQSSYQALAFGKREIWQSRSQHSQLRHIKAPSKSRPIKFFI